MPYTIFISRSHRDRWIARQIVRHLKDLGLEPWLDEKRVDAGRVPDKVKEGIHASDEMCVLVSSASLDSDWVKHAVGAADILDRPISLVMDKISPRDRPETWVNFDLLDLNDFDDYLDGVANRARDGRHG